MGFALLMTTMCWQSLVTLAHYDYGWCLLVLVFVTEPHCLIEYFNVVNFQLFILLLIELKTVSRTLLYVRRHDFCGKRPTLYFWNN